MSAGVNLKWVVIAAAILLAFTILASPKTILPSKLKFDYFVSGCEKKIEVKNVAENYGEPGIRVQNNNIIISHDLSYVCCAKMKLDYKIDNDSLEITEINEGELCKCICNYNITAVVGPLKDGAYTVKVYGILYQNIKPNLLAEKEVKIATKNGIVSDDYYCDHADPYYCENNEDCICANEGCFIGSKEFYKNCVNKNKTCYDFCSGWVPLTVLCEKNRCAQK